MTENKIVGVIDEPIAERKYDALKLELHSSALVEFIEDTTTPMTIGIQGEWGSGKTSLLNSIKGQLYEDKRYKQIWINSWENSLLTTPEEALIKIINAIIEELLESDKDKNRKEKIMSAASTVFKGAMRIGAVAALGKKAGDVAEELLETKENGIKALRGHLYSLVNEIRERSSNPYEKIIIYVDDLDRIEPKDAVQILELLKNIFSVPGCVFILAIDYQVVVKGLEHKFGKQTPENEWEFRAFFDKIIQLPFMMPMGQYDIGNYVTSLLTDIGFIEKDSIDSEDIKEIVLLTIGGNPRAIKRLVNSVSLIEIFTKHKIKLDSNEDKEKILENIKEKKFLLFSLLCLQIAYPAIYSLLIEEPDFTKWDDDFAFSHTNKEEEKEKELFNQEFNNAINSEDFNEDWEKSLFRICYVRPRLKPNTINVSRFLSFIKDKYNDETKEMGLGALLAEVLAQTSVTSVNTTDQSQNTVNTERFKRTMFEGIDAWENSYLENFKGRDNYSEIKKCVEVVRILHDKVIKSLGSYDFEMKYSKTGGCTCYSTKNRTKKFLAISPYKTVIKVEILKDFEKDYRIPRIPHLKTSHIRNYNPDKPATAAFGEQYQVFSEVNEDLIKNYAIVEKLVLRSFIIAQEHIDKIFKPHEGNDEEAINKQKVTLASDYTYDYN